MGKGEEERKGGRKRSGVKARIQGTTWQCSLEFPDPFYHLPVFIIAEVVIVPARVPGVEGMEPDHVESLFGQLAVVTHKDAIHVLIVAK